MIYSRFTFSLHGVKLQGRNSSFMHSFIQLIIIEPIVGGNRGQCDNVRLQEMSGWWERRADPMSQSWGSRRLREHPGRGGGFPLALTFKFRPERRAKSAFETRPVWFRRAESLCKDLEAREPILGTKTTAINNG